MAALKIDLDRYERALREQGFARIAGVDEAGRGALAGPLVAAAVILPEGFDREGIDDSKMLTANQVITRDPDVLGGTPVFRGTRVPFQALLDYLEGGQTLAEFLDDFPTVTRDAAIAALEHAKLLLVSQLG